MFSSQKPYYTNASDVPRSLQSWVSTIQKVVLTADVFQLFIKNLIKLVNKKESTAESAYCSVVGSHKSTRVDEGRKSVSILATIG